MNKKVIFGCAAAAAIVCAVVIPRLMRQETFADPVADPAVFLTKPERQDIRLTSGLIGTIEPEDVVYVYPKAAGDVTEVMAKAGESVQEGQLLCIIDTRQVEGAKSTLDSAELALRQAREELSRQSVLYAGGGISQQAYQQYQDQVKAAEISYNNAKNNYDNQVSYSQVKAPISGIIEFFDIELHDTVSAGNRICVISGLGSKVVSFSVTERIKFYLQEGDRVEVQKDGESFSAAITEISSMVDEATGLYKVKAALEEGPDTKLLSTGSMVKLSVVTESAENALAVPVDSVYYDGGLAYVYTYDPASGTLRKVSVETGIYDAEWIEVKQGLEETAEVLLTWSSELYDGAPVRVMEETETAPAASETEK